MIRRRLRFRQICSGRRGAVLVAVIVCLVLVSLLTTSLLKLASIQRNQVRHWQHELQADWLGFSALERAVQRLGIEADYRRETWTVPAKQLGSAFDGEVDIAVQADEDRPGQYIVRIQATYPSGKVDAVRRTKEFTVNVPQE